MRFSLAASLLLLLSRTSAAVAANGRAEPSRTATSTATSSLRATATATAQREVEERDGDLLTDELWESREEIFDEFYDESIEVREETFGESDFDETTEVRQDQPPPPADPTFAATGLNDTVTAGCLAASGTSCGECIATTPLNEQALTCTWYASSQICGEGCADGEECGALVCPVDLLTCEECLGEKAGQQYAWIAEVGQCVTSCGIVPGTTCFEGDTFTPEVCAGFESSGMSDPEPQPQPQPPVEPPVEPQEPQEPEDMNDLIVGPEPVEPEVLPEPVEPEVLPEPEMPPPAMAIPMPEELTTCEECLGEAAQEAYAWAPNVGQGGSCVTDCPANTACFPGIAYDATDCATVVGDFVEAVDEANVTVAVPESDVSKEEPAVEEGGTEETGQEEGGGITLLPPGLQELTTCEQCLGPDAGGTYAWVPAVGESGACLSSCSVIADTACFSGAGYDATDCGGVIAAAPIPEEPMENPEAPEAPPAEPPIAPEAPVAPDMPPAEEMGQQEGIYITLDTCAKCLGPDAGGTYAWVPAVGESGACLSSCSVIADTACFSGAGYDETDCDGVIAAAPIPDEPLENPEALVPPAVPDMPVPETPMVTMEPTATSMPSAVATSAVPTIRPTAKPTEDVDETADGSPPDDGTTSGAKKVAIVGGTALVGVAVTLMML